MPDSQDDSLSPSSEADAGNPPDAQPAPDAQPKRNRLSRQVLAGLTLGVAAGLFFGEYCEPLGIVGDVFVGLLRMAVLPYIIVSLIANLGQLTLGESRRLALVGGVVLLMLWGIVLTLVLTLPNSFPDRDTGEFFSARVNEASAEVDFKSFFIPTNIFKAVTDGNIPAVVIGCICVGLGLGRVSGRETIIEQLKVISRVMMRVSGMVAQLAPLGVFAISASAAGTMSFSDLTRLQGYLFVYIAAALILGFIAMPLLVASVTPFSYRQVLRTTRASMITAFATGKLIIVLPMLIEETERLFEQQQTGNGHSGPAVDVLYPIAYTFPHSGKLMSAIFIPFAAWFLGEQIAYTEFPGVMASGLFAYFGGPIIAIPFLLDQLRLPQDMFQLFLLSGVLGERFGDAVGAVHLAAFTIITVSAFSRNLQVTSAKIGRFLVVSGATTILTVICLRTLLNYTVVEPESKRDVLARLQLIEAPVAAKIVAAEPNPEPLGKDETVLQRIRRREILRVGYNEDRHPFAYINGKGQLVGYDINMAHTLARNLGVTLEFVRFDEVSLERQLKDDHFDIAMSAVVGTLDRSEWMQHSKPYMDATLALVVRDSDADTFATLESIQRLPSVRIGYLTMGRAFAGRLHELAPRAELIKLDSNRSFFEEDSQRVDALLTSGESGAAFTLMHPEFTVAIPSDARRTIPLIYPIGARDVEMRNFVDYWLDLRRSDGTLDEYYNHWILGKEDASPPPRWSVLRNVLGFGKESLNATNNSGRE